MRPTYVLAALALICAGFLIPGYFQAAYNGDSPQRGPSPVVVADKNARRIGIIGAAGYVGSALDRYLRSHNYWNVTGFDRNPRSKYFPVKHLTSNEIPTEELQSFEAVVFLGGLTGRVACDTNPPSTVYRENVENVVALAKRMKPSQLLIFASTSAVGEGSAGVPFREMDAPHVDVLDSYSASMYKREITMRELATSADYFGPTLVALRFGTVVGVSPSQRIEFVHNAMVRTALLRGEIHLSHPETWRAFLWIPDQVRAIETVILKKHALDSRSMNLFQLISFNSRIGQAATEVAQMTGARIVAHHHPPNKDIHGFSLSGERMAMSIGFRAEGTQRKVIEELLVNLHHLVIAREKFVHANDAVPCRVCGSHDMMTVLDLGMQPLANDFRPTTEDSLRCERYPLKLMRCRRCNHAQLSVMVDRKPLFTNYSYRSGTSSTLNKYFEWLAKRVTKEVVGSETVLPKRSKSVLELACNDGTQLNHFRDLGWATYGVDPAVNLVGYARAEGHTVISELWGASQESKYSTLPKTFDAIVAQNVLAHVPNPTDFLAGCVRRMDGNSKMYIQTSQCDMFSDGQFDTVYHEHISFFSPKSFRYLAEAVGLKIIKWEITPIHGGSCFVTMVKQESLHQPDSTLPNAITQERARGQLQDSYFVRYREQAKATRDWMNTVLHQMSEQGHDIVGYGAAAKGMVLLQFMLAQSPRYQFQYVVDDAPLKQNNYCPGTSIPVKPTAELTKHDSTKPLTIVVFSWNFWKEIKVRIAKALRESPRPHKSVWVVLPFPRQEVVALQVETGELLPIVSNPFSPVPWTFPRPPVVGAVVHFHNDEFLLPYWILHHAHLFDGVTAVDVRSDDSSASLFQQYAPSQWHLVNVTALTLDGQELDNEVAFHEQRFGQIWRVALSASEFVVHQSLRSELQAMERNVEAVRLLTCWTVGADSTPLRRFETLVKQRTRIVPGNWASESRFVHRVRISHDQPNPYEVGRRKLRSHRVLISNETISKSRTGWIADFTFWPEYMRKKSESPNGKKDLSQFQDVVEVQPDGTLRELEALYATTEVSLKYRN